MKRFIFLILIMMVVHANATADTYPDKAITIIVHSKAGSGVDMMARKLASLAPQYCDQPIVVQNLTGGSGAVAMRNVAGKDADGYTILACTKSFISTVLLSESDLSLDQFHFLACLISFI